MRFWRLICGLACLLCAPACFALDGLKLDANPAGDVVMVQGAPAMLHFNASGDHVKYSWLVGVEWQHVSRWLAGYSYFNNSFGQKSQYIYGGYWWPLDGVGPNWYAKLTGGLLQGYKQPYEDKVPFNHNGKSPGIVAGLGYKIGRYNAQMNLLGGAGVMLTVGYDLVR